MPASSYPLGLALALAAALTATAARADEPAPTTPPASTARSRASVPLRLIDRPLVLPAWVVQLTFEAGIANLSYEDDSFNLPQYYKGTGATVAVGVDVGLSHRLQAGVFFDFPVHPTHGLGLFVFDVAASLAPAVAARLDLGMLRYTTLFDAGDGPLVLTRDGFVLGVGLPVSLRLHRVLALVSGNSAARGFGTQPYRTASDSMGQYDLLFSDDLFVLSTMSDRHTYALTLPVGLRLQPWSHLALTARTAYRLVVQSLRSFSDVPTVTGLRHYVPLALDLVVSPIRQLDIGFTAQLSGQVASSGYGADEHQPSWAELRQFDFWISGRGW